MNAEYKDDDVYEKNLLGKERSKEAAAAYMKQFESDLHAEMKENKTKYTKKAGGCAHTTSGCSLALVTCRRIQPTTGS